MRGGGRPWLTGTADSYDYDFYADLTGLEVNETLNAIERPIIKPVEPVKLVKVVNCGYCNQIEEIKGDRVNVYCKAYNRVFPKSNTECPADQPVEVVKPRMPERPAPVVVREEVREEKPIIQVSEEELERRLDAIDQKRLAAEAEEDECAAEKKEYARLLQNHYKPAGFIDEITKPKRDQDGNFLRDDNGELIYDDRVDRKSLWDSSLTVRENTKNLKNQWRSGAMA
jgi:hypothetical protein